MIIYQQPPTKNRQKYTEMLCTVKPVLKVLSGGISDFLFYENFIFQWNVDATYLKWNGS